MQLLVKQNHTASLSHFLCYLISRYYLISPCFFMSRSPRPYYQLRCYFRRQPCWLEQSLVNTGSMAVEPLLLAIIGDDRIQWVWPGTSSIVCGPTERDAWLRFTGSSGYPRSDEVKTSSSPWPITTRLGSGPLKTTKKKATSISH